MITLLITRGDDEGVYLHLPASPTEIREAYSELDSISADRTSQIRIIEVQSNVYNLGGYIKSADIEAPGALDKLNGLARTLQTMDRNDCKKFEGVLDANSVNGVDDVLRLAESLDEYAVFPGADTGSALGKYLVEHGVGSFPENVRPYLDYQLIGDEFYSERGGAFCELGYVVRKDALPQQLLQAAEEQKNDWDILLRLRVTGRRITAVDLPLPATDAEIDRVKQKLGIDELAEAEIIMVDYSLPYLAQYIPQDCITVEEANELALAIEEMRRTDGEAMKFLSVLVIEQPQTFADVYRLALDLDDYERIPSDMEAYGREVLRRIGAGDELLDTIDGFADFEALGKFYMQDEGVMWTEFGLVRRLSEPFYRQGYNEMSME